MKKKFFSQGGLGKDEWLNSDQTFGLMKDWIKERKMKKLVGTLGLIVKEQTKLFKS